MLLYSIANCCFFIYLICSLFFYENLCLQNLQSGTHTQINCTFSLFSIELFFNTKELFLSVLQKQNFGFILFIYLNLFYFINAKLPFSSSAKCILVIFLIIQEPWSSIRILFTRSYRYLSNHIIPNAKFVFPQLDIFLFFLLKKNLKRK